MRRQLPPWAMGLACAPLGFYFGFISTATPILLRAHGVPVETIGKVSSIGFSPRFWAFLLCPVLDVRFSKRTYAFFFAGLAAVCLGVSTLLTFHLVAFTVVLTLGCAAIVLFGNAHQGWMPDAVEEKHFSAVGAMSTVANLGAAGLFAWLTVSLLRAMSPHPAGLLLALCVFAPTGLLLFIPQSGTPLRPAREVFGSFFRDLYQVCKRRSSILGLMCFLSPTACFALTNSFSDLGTDFHSSEQWVTRINGPLVAIVCSAGALVGIWFCQRFLRRTVYVMAGFGGAAAAIAMIWMPHTLVFFAVGVLVYNFFQGINYTAFSAFEYEIVGPGNVLAATQISLLTAAANAPISYMTFVETQVYTKHGLPGMLGVDAVASVVVGTVLLMVFRRMGRRRVGEVPALAGG
jgi:MFS transporter, PAT family, beta-lactamase induction signal transducer AmpG